MLGQANCDNAMMQVTILAATTERHQVKSFTMEPLPSKKSSREILLQTLDEVEKLLDIEDWWLRIGDEDSTSCSKGLDSWSKNYFWRQSTRTHFLRIKEHILFDHKATTAQIEDKTYK